MDTNLPDALVDQQGLFDPVESGPPVTLAERFVIPPFSVLDKRSGDWNRRRRQWLGLGIRSEVGRGEALTYNVSNDGGEEGWTSIFDPVLCELAYRWFSRPGDRILDPFAGGSVRGVVASWLARYYTGVELRPEQVVANYEQLDICDDAHLPRWVLGDARDIAAGDVHDEYDLVFTCPPYADLEVYSDDPRDLSTLHYDDFLREYEACLKASASVLRDDRCFVVVIGDVRDRRSVDGRYYGLTVDTVNVARRIGLSLYNEAILVTPPGSLALRTGPQFEKSRKLGRGHQTVLMFTKGNARAAASRLDQGGDVALSAEAGTHHQMNSALSSEAAS